jgi:thiamine-phosphate pyrophosphorylase
MTDAAAARARTGVAVPALPRLMLVTDRHETGGRDLTEVVAAAVAGGVGLVQVRERDLSEAELGRLLHRILARLAGTPARILVNGHPELARALGVGLHLPAAAAPLAGPRPALYGRAVHDEAEARRAHLEGVDYVVVGPVFPTASKPGHPGAGVERLARLAAAVRPRPAFAIGGITAARVDSVRAAGAHGVAVLSAILAARDPASAAQALADALRASGMRAEA